jgi:hypothetical protein
MPIINIRQSAEVNSQLSGAVTMLSISIPLRTRNKQGSILHEAKPNSLHRKLLFYSAAAGAAVLLLQHE